MRLILASSSPQRKTFMEMIGYEFEIIPSNVDERAVDESDPVRLARRLARLKAEAVAAKAGGDAIVIGADTLVSFRGSVIGKARDREHASETLKEYAGKEHTQITGICIINTRTGRVLEDHQETRIRCREMTGDEIEAYVATGEPMKGAGCYTPRAHPMLFSRVDGSWANIVGMPMERFVVMLGEAMRE